MASPSTCSEPEDLSDHPNMAIVYVEESQRFQFSPSIKRWGERSSAIHGVAQGYAAGRHFGELPRVTLDGILLTTFQNSAVRGVRGGDELS